MDFEYVNEMLEEEGSSQSEEFVSESEDSEEEKMDVD